MIDKVTYMNPGFLTFILITIVLILLISGWKDAILKHISMKSVVVFFCLFFISYGFSFQAGEMRFKMTYVLLIALLVMMGVRRLGIARLMLFMFLGIVFALFQYLLLEVYQVNPLMPVVAPKLDIAIFIGAMSFIATRNAAYQFWLISISLIIGDICHQYGHREMIDIYLGNKSFFDMWSLSLFTSMFIALGIEMYHVAKRQMSWPNLCRLMRSRANERFPKTNNE